MVNQNSNLLLARKSIQSLVRDQIIILEEHKANYLRRLEHRVENFADLELVIIEIAECVRLIQKSTTLEVLSQESTDLLILLYKLSIKHQIEKIDWATNFDFSQFTKKKSKSKQYARST
jgi:hypothetical protein